MSALSTLKGNCTKGRTALLSEETDTNELIKWGLGDIDKHQVVQNNIVGW